MRLFLLVLLLSGCGARTALEIAADAGTDAAQPPEICDGADDDGDGAIDEGIAPITCGTGACRNDVPGCRAGVVPECTPRPPSMEACNGADDDCDGRVDEGLGFGAVGEPIVVRDVADFGDDRCSTCAIPFGPDVVSTSEGMLVTWRLGFDGSAPIPNTFARLVGDDGSPLAPIRLLFDRDTTQGPRSAPGPDGAALVYCGRVRSDDVAMSSLLDPRGAARAETPRSPTGRSCGAWEPDALFTGSRWLFAWTDNSTGPLPGFEVLLDVADTSSASVSPQMLEENASSGPRMALGHGRVMLVVDARPEPARSRLAIHRFDPSGAPLGGAVYLDMPDGADDAFETPHVVPTATGWTVHAASARREGGRFVAELEEDGTPRGEVRRVDEGVRFVNGFDDVIARASGGALVATPTQVGDAWGYAVLAVGDDGATVAQWTPEITPDVGFAWGQLVEHRGRVYLAYVTLLGDNRGQVRLQELGCR